MWPKPKVCYRTTTITIVVAVLFVGVVHNLKCRTTDHSRRQGEFIDIAEQCRNATTGERPASVDSDYYMRYSGDRRTAVEDGRMRNDQENRRNSNREFNVRRQEFANNNRGTDGDYSNYDRGNSGNSGNSGNHDPTRCSDVQPQQQYSGYNRPNNNRQGNRHYPSADYDDARLPDLESRQSSTRRYRRDVTNNNHYYHYNKNYGNRRRKAATSGSRLLGNNRFRNVTKIVAMNPSKGSILDKIDACTIHCVFNQLEMLNSNARPDKSSILNIMTNQIKDVELKEFIHDSIDECFDTLELDSHNNKCEFSKNFAVCMENKAQRNCDDWDDNQKT